MKSPTSPPFEKGGSGGISGEPPEEHVRRFLWLAETLPVECIISIGYPAELPREVPRDCLNWDRIRGRDHADGKPSEDHIRQLLGLPENLSVESIMSIGYPAEAKAGIPKGSLDAAKIRFNRWL